MPHLRKNVIGPSSLSYSKVQVVEALTSEQKHADTPKKW